MEHSGPANPGKQVQLLTLVLFAGDVETPGHSMQEVKPGVFPYVPGLQAVQELAPVLSAYVPASHTKHSVGAGSPHAQQASAAEMPE